MQQTYNPAKLYNVAATTSFNIDLIPDEVTVSALQAYGIKTVRDIAVSGEHVEKFIENIRVAFCSIDTPHRIYVSEADDEGNPHDLIDTHHTTPCG